MTDKIKNEICETIKLTIDSKGHILLADLNNLFDNNKKELFEVIEELKDGQVVRTPPAGHSLLPGLRYKSFKTYDKFIDDVNFGDKRRFKVTVILSVVVILLTIIGIIVSIKSNQAQQTDKQSEEVLPTPDTSVRDTAQENSSDSTDSLGQGVKVEK